MVRVRQPGEGGGRKGAAHSPGRPQNNTRLWREARASLRIPVSPTVAGGRALKLSEVTGASVVENVAASQTAGARAHGLVETDDGVRAAGPPAAYSLSPRRERESCASVTRLFGFGLAGAQLPPAADGAGLLH